ncbi:hypothetical protein TWF481_002762 [Arthrobotrys musiformis]|uniref:Uncharacterized protein n=1 Tax=Arthrobotrys musiformis TaxID=47236 RepID=A0AAV9VXA8_9PEZI
MMEPEHPPRVPKPKVKSKKSIKIIDIERAFGDIYWLERTGDWSRKIPLHNILTIIQAKCDHLLDIFGNDMIEGFNFRRQGKDLKDDMYRRLLSLIRDDEAVDPSYMSLALDMLEASTDPENSSRWLLEYCMRRTEENRISRESRPEKKAPSRISEYNRVDQGLDEEFGSSPAASANQRRGLRIDDLLNNNAEG